MKLFRIYIKSHTEAPDYEREIEAESKEEASELFAKDAYVRNEEGEIIEKWSAKDLLPYIDEAE